eukprot:382564_1
MGACATKLQKEKKKSQHDIPEHNDDEDININKSVKHQTTMYDNKQQHTIVVESPKNNNVNDDKDINIKESLKKHQKMMNNANIKVDLTTFGNIHDDDNDFDKCQAENCHSLQRILTASTYYG